MTAHLDHLILMVNDAKQSIEFYTRILGFTYEGERAPFSTIRVTPDFILQLAPWGTKGGEHLAFAMTRADFDAAFGRIRESGIAYGDTFESVGNMRGPGEAAGARGKSTSVYVFDPNKHLIEITHYE
jgi:catechol 2,3-dioxygenase-like lactoylglutathione lyase family enzyme